MEIINFINNLDNSLSEKKSKFNSVSDIEKKKIYPFLESDDTDDITFEFLVDANVNKDRYELTDLEMIYFQRKVCNFIKKNENVVKNYIDPYNVTRVSPLSLINFTFDNETISKNDLIKNKDFSYVKNHNKIEKLGIYLLPKEASPAFKNFKMVINFLKKHFDLYIFLENNEYDMDECDKFILSNTNHYYIANKSDGELFDFIYDKQLTLLISIYGFWKRQNTFKGKPVPVMVNYLEPSIIYPTYFYDYNLVDEHIDEVLKTVLDTNKFKTMVLKDTFIFPIPYYSNFKTLKDPVYNPEDIRLGVILHGAKISYKLVKLLKEIISISPKIKLTIYGYFKDGWVKKLFDSDQVVHDKYDHKNPDKLLDNILYIDTIIYNNHSTALELLKLRRPLISYFNNKTYHGSFSQSIIKNINMEKYLLAKNITQYKKLVELYISNEKTYNKLYQKFVKNIDDSKILSFENYAEKLANSLNDSFNNDIKINNELYKN